MDKCCAAGVVDERDKVKPDEKLYECVHGKKLTWKTARAVLGLPTIVEEKKEKG